MKSMMVKLKFLFVIGFLLEMHVICEIRILIYIHMYSYHTLDFRRDGKIID